MIVATGLSHAVLDETDATAGDPVPYLRNRKSRKFMGVQDDLAVVAAGRALASAGLAGQDLGERTGLYIAVGHIPFRESDIDPVLAASVEDGRFSMKRFSSGGFQKAHPLVTFRCLPNMPAYHVSANFDVQGPYLVTYPGAGQLALALDEACAALEAGEVDTALVGGVAHQRNFLVEHHFGRVVPPVERTLLRDAGAFVVLETEERARARGAAIRGRLESLSVAYEPFDPTESMPAYAEHFEIDGREQTDARRLGPASVLVLLSAAWGGTSRAASVKHRVRSQDGIVASSAWTREVPS